MKPHYWSALTIVALSLSASSLATAASTTTNFNVTATVTANCLATSTNLNFGTYDPLSSSDTTGSSLITIKCSKGTPYTIALNAGTRTSATDTTRQMSHATVLAATAMNYGLYSDSGTLSNWVSSSSTVGGTGSGLNTGNDHTVYGKIPKNQYDVYAGSYSDTIIATISY